jgi:Subtilase family
LPNNPVQVILNTRDYLIAPDPGRFGPAKDFFAGRDQDFVDHRDKLLRQVASIATAFQRSNIPAGVVKVSLQREALAKSHRPQRALFPPGKRPCIGASKLGELYYHITEDDVTELEQEIAAAEAETRHRISARSGKKYLAPSNQRSDVGAVESIELPTAAEKRQFGAEEAIKWLADLRTSGAYFVELFSPPPNLLPGLAANFIQHVTNDVVATATGRGLHVETFPVEINAGELQRPTRIVGVRLMSAEAEEDSAISRSIEEHSRLLTIFDAHPYVRRVHLPPIVVAAKAQTSTVDSGSVPALPRKQPRLAYPKIGIIDGGLGSHLGEWTVGAHTIVAPEHQETDHGSFIAGLLVGGQSLNGPSVCREPDGCDLFDIGILPDTDEQLAFETYYPNGVVDFLKEIDTGVEIARRDQGIRIFNMSLNLLDPVQGEGYGIVANLLDQIADKHDIIFVISAGNLRPTDCRSEWPADAQAALQHLASRNVIETVLQPAESSRSIAVGALNPPGCPGRVAGVPAAYTRRGPGLRVGVKPDVGHFGGALPDSRSRTGLRSWADDRTIVLGHGTSYAAPQVAKTLAGLDARVVSPLSRELLLGLLVHGCEVPQALSDPALTEVARQFTGFGMPADCARMLQTPDHAITLAFADVLHANRELQFDFAWPRSLVNRETGACKGDVRMTLVYRPVLNRDFGSEFVRVNVDAHLRQEHKGTFVGRVKQTFLPADPGTPHFEHELIEHGLKWWPIKVYRDQFPRGKGRSSNWRLSVESLVRSGEFFPAAGVPFALVLTIADIQESEPVFNDLRLHLRSRNVQIADIRATTQVRVQA